MDTGLEVRDDDRWCWADSESKDVAILVAQGEKAVKEVVREVMESSNDGKTGWSWGKVFGEPPTPIEKDPNKGGGNRDDHRVHVFLVKSLDKICRLAAGGTLGVDQQELCEEVVVEVCGSGSYGGGLVRQSDTSRHCCGILTFLAARQPFTFHKEKLSRQGKVADILQPGCLGFVRQSLYFLFCLCGSMRQREGLALDRIFSMLGYMCKGKGLQPKQ